LSSNFYHIYASFAAYALAMACVNMVWNLGPAHLAPPGAERLYMSIHMTFVGLRAAIGYPLALLIKNLSNYETVFLLVFALEMIAAYRMHVLGKQTTPGPPVNLQRDDMDLENAGVEANPTSPIGKIFFCKIGMLAIFSVTMFLD